MNLKKTIPPSIKESLKLMPLRIRCFNNRHLRMNTLTKKKNGLHIGCGDIRIPSLLNLDVRVTRATDVACDSTLLGIFSDKAFPMVFSNAFFEHLYLTQRIPHLEEVKRVLKKGGFALYLGMPDFKIVAESYLKNKPGILYNKFDTNEVYRYTHGNPEQAPSWWLEQLHKSLFDKKTLSFLLENAGFKYYLLFNYVFRDENIPLNLGFIAFNDKPRKKMTGRIIETIAKRYTDDIASDSINIILNKRI